MVMLMAPVAMLAFTAVSASFRDVYEPAAAVPPVTLTCALAPAEAVNSSNNRQFLIKTSQDNCFFALAAMKAKGIFPFITGNKYPDKNNNFFILFGLIQVMNNTGFAGCIDTFVKIDTIR